MTKIHQEVVIKATSTQVYEALTEARIFSLITEGSPTELSADEGASISCFGGMITGRNIELVPGKRVVQAWRAKMWPDGIYSIAKFELVPEGNETKLVFDQTGFPEEHGAHLADGWHKKYWEPLQQYFSK